MPATPPVRRMAGRPATSKPTARPAETPSDPTPNEQQQLEAAKSRLERKTKISSATLRKLFEDPNNQLNVSGERTPFRKLYELIRDRVKDGRRMSLRDWRIYYAIDAAYNAPQQQISPTLIGQLLSGSKRLTPTQIKAELARLGLSEDTLFITVKDPADSSKEKQILNKETFHKVLVPIVKAIVNARESKLFEDYNNNPFLVYSPQRQTEEYKLAGDIITNLVEGITIAYGLKAVLRASIHNALRYSFAIAFPAEVWHYVKDIDSNGEEYTRKEGLRYNIPHPTRVAWDQSFRPATLNTDTGCSWVMYWKLTRFGEIDSNSNYYNKDKIQYGTCWFKDFDYYFEHVYPCTMEKPADPNIWASDAKTRETCYINTSSNDYDKAVFETNVFMKLKPAQWGLGDYAHELWFRFVVGNEDTVIYAEPIPYSPALYLGTDAADATSTRTSSFALEGIPWQDLVGNIVSQHWLAVKQNCIRVICYDKTQITEPEIREIEARGRESISTTWVPYDPRDIRVGQQKLDEMLVPLTLPQTNTAEIINTVTQVFNIMERALGMSAQEVGAIAGHIQTAEEIRTVSSNTSSRVNYLGSFIDEFLDAMKRQIYTGFQHFGDEQFVVSVNGVDRNAASKLKEKFGFQLVDEKSTDDAVEFKGDLSKLSVDAFISSREGKTRLNQPQVAQVMMQTIQAIAANADLAQRVGADAILKMMNRAAKLAGAPEDFELKIMPEATAVMELKQLSAAIQEYSKQIADAAAQQATAAASEAAQRAAGDVASQAGEAIRQVSEKSDAAIDMNQQLAAKLAELQQMIQDISVIAQAHGAAPPVDQPIIPAPAV